MAKLALLAVLLLSACGGGFTTAVQTVSGVSSSSTGSIAQATSLHARIHIVDQNGFSIPGAQVTANWGGVISGTTTMTSDATGWATLASPISSKAGTYTVTVSSVSLTGANYDSSKNKISSASLSR